MSSAQRPYPSYRTPAHPWIEKVPSHWEERRAKVFFREVNDRSETGKEELLSVSHLTGVTPRSQKNVTMFKAESYVGHKRCQPGDIIINTMWAWMAALGVARHVGLVSPAYGLYRAHDPETYNPRYTDYLLRSQAYVSEYNCRSTGIQSSRLRLYPAQFLDIPLIRPPREEQDQIVAYLHVQDAKIARFIRDKRRLIEVLNEQKQTLIHRAVTRGLDPDVKLRPSGVEWLGAVPEHWELKKLKYAVRFRGGSTPPKANPALWSGAIPWVSPKDMRVSRIVDTKDHVSQSALRDSNLSLIAPGSVLVVVRSGVLRRRIPAAINDVTVTLNQDMKALIPGPRLSTEYLAALIEGHQRSFLAAWTKVGATVESIEHAYMANTVLALPSLSEQAQILEHINAELIDLDAATAQVAEQISQMLEYRGRLIADVVTGQLDVRGWVPGPDDVIDEAAEELDDEYEAAMGEQGAADEDDGHE